MTKQEYNGRYDTIANGSIGEMNRTAEALKAGTIDRGESIRQRSNRIAKCMAAFIALDKEVEEDDAGYLAAHEGDIIDPQFWGVL